MGPGRPHDKEKQKTPTYPYTPFGGPEVHTKTHLPLSVCTPFMSTCSAVQEDDGFKQHVRARVRVS